MIAKEILMYGEMNSYSCSEFINNINLALEKDEKAEIRVRMNTPGGDPDYGWGAVAKFAELTGPKSVVADGKCHSMGLFYCCYTPNVTAFDFTTFVFHRAGYPSWYENDPNFFTEDRKASLAGCNKKLRAAFEGKVDVPLFEKITGVTLDEVFSMDGRIDVLLTAAQAKRIGLIKDYITLTPSKSAQKKAEIEALLLEITAKQNDIPIAAKTSTPKNKIMNIEEYKTENPAAFAAFVDKYNKKIEKAVKAEKERIQEWLFFREADKKMVDAGIASGEAMTRVQVLELSEKKANAKKQVEDLEEDSTKEVSTGAAPSSVKSKAQKDIEEFAAKAASNSQFLSKPSPAAKTK